MEKSAKQVKVASPLAVKSSKSHKGPSVVNIGSEEVLWWRPQAYATRPAITSTVRENKKHHSIRGKVGGVARKAGGGARHILYAWHFHFMLNPVARVMYGPTKLLILEMDKRRYGLS